MRRTAWIAGAAATLALAACGGTTSGSGPRADAGPATPTPTPDVVADTDGRLGPASAATSDAPPVELSPGGRPDLGDHEQPADRAGVGAAASCANPELAPDAGSMPFVLKSTLCLVNAERIDRGLAPLTENARLATAARRYAEDMVAGGYFSHTGRDGSDFSERLRRVGYIPTARQWAIGENLAWGTGALATPAAIVRAWMNSPGHRANVLEPRYREIGLGVAIGNPAGADGVGATYATEFGAVAGAARVSRKRTVRTRTARAARRALQARRTR